MISVGQGTRGKVAVMAVPPPAHLASVLQLVRLRAQRPHRRALQGSKLGVRALKSSCSDDPLHSSTLYKGTRFR